MFYEAPFLSLIIFGFPFGVISIVFYFLCCIDSNEQMDDADEFSESEEEIETEQINSNDAAKQLSSKKTE